MPREVITLQLGSFANYVGAHYWNFQDELLGLQEQAGEEGPAAQIDSDVLFRAGETAGGQPTYTPRLVLWDLNGALGGASAGGSLYRDRHQGSGAGVVSTWSGGQEVHQAVPVQRSRFAQELEEEPEGPLEAEAEAEAAAGDAASGSLAAAAAQLDSSGGGSSAGAAGGVRYFTDFLKAHLHPRSVHQLVGAWHGLTPFGGWGDGGEHWRSEEQREASMERIRFFAEECDQLQGIQAWVDDLTGFGQLTARLLQEVRDEYGVGLPVMLYALRPSAAAAALAAGGDAAAAAAAATDDLAELRRRRLNLGLSLSSLAPLCSTFTVLTPPSPAPGILPLLRWQAGNPYHASGICAAALDTATLPYRLVEGGGGPAASIGRTGMWNMSQLLTAQHRSPLTALSLAMPCAALPADQQRSAQRADSRLQHGPGGLAGGAGAGAGEVGQQQSQDGPFTQRGAASLTPGIPACGDAARFAECVVLRGPRSAGAALHLGAAAEALDAVLAMEQMRCVRHRTLAAQPLAVPLPFPHIFAREVCQQGDTPAGGTGGGGGNTGRGGGSHDITSCAVLTRLAATAAFKSAVASAQREFGSAAGTAQGQAALESWGLGREELGVLQEQLEQLAHAYEEGD